MTGPTSWYSTGPYTYRQWLSDLQHEAIYRNFDLDEANRYSAIQSKASHAELNEVMSYEPVEDELDTSKTKVSDEERF